MKAMNMLCASGRTAERRSFFTPCTPAGSLLETTTEAAKGAPFGDANSLSPACSSFDQFRNDQQSGEFLCRMVKSIGRGVRGGNPNMDDKTVTAGCERHHDEK